MRKQPDLKPTHDIGVALPVNTKYLSANPVSRILIRGFLGAVVDLTRRVNPRRMVDIGCGEGLILRQLSVLWDDAEFVGVDLSSECLSVARGLAPAGEYLIGDACQLPLPGRRFELVLCTEVLEHLDEPGAALSELVRISSGHCLLSVPREPWWRIANMARGSYLSDWGNTPGHVKHWTSQGFVRFVGTYLEVEAVRRPFPWTVVLARVQSR